MAIVSLAVVAAGDDNATTPPTESKSSPSGSPSYFEGVWIGSWASFRSTSVTQDVTLSIVRGAKEGIFIVEYSWTGGPAGYGFPVFPGSVKTKGKDEGEQFVFGWKNKEGKDLNITLKKHENDKVKARLERSGPYGPNERPHNETTLKRK